MKLCSFDARSKGQPRTLPYREGVGIGGACWTAFLNSLLASSTCRIEQARPAGAGSLALRDRGTSCVYPQGAGRPVYADGDQSI